MQRQPAEMPHREYHVARIHPLFDWDEGRPDLHDLHGSDGASSSTSSTSYHKNHSNDDHEVEMHEDDDDAEDDRQRPQKSKTSLIINALSSPAEPGPFSVDNDGRRNETNEGRQYNYAGHYIDRSRRRSNRKYRRSCGAALCVCYAIAVFLLVLFVLLVIAAAVLYLILLPKAPTFSVADAHVSKFNLTAGPLNHDRLSMPSPMLAAGAPDDQQRLQPAPKISYLQTDVTFAVRAGNPNKKIAIDYQHILVTLLYQQLVIGSGSLPAFYLASGDSKQLQLEMKGEDTPLTPRTIGGDILRKALVMKDHGRRYSTAASSSIELKVQTVTHARIQVWKWMSHAAKFRVDCDVELTNPSSPEATRLLSKACKLKVVNLWT